MTAHIPNLLTLLRIAATPVLIVLLNDGHYDLALGLFIIAGISDGLDGFIAKRFSCQTRLGAMLDPVADKIFIVSTGVMLAIKGDIPLWLLVTIGFRDLVIVGGFMLLTLLHGQLQMQPSFLSKFNTVLQIALLVAVLLTKAANLQIDGLITILVATVFVTTVLSGVHYVWLWGLRRPRDLVESRGIDSDTSA
jgi:cardiolipin synthase